MPSSLNWFRPSFSWWVPSFSWLAPSLRAVSYTHLVDAAYAAANFPLPVITVDLGTATTFNVVDKDRVFRGCLLYTSRCV